MNKNCYRIVFNRSRGQLMAVQETAGSVSGSASGERSGSSIPGARTSTFLATLRSSMRHVLFTLGLTIWVPMAWTQTLAPSPTAAAGARPIVDAAANGVPIVHIAPPNAVGVSRNQFSNFNVGTAGLIENNSAASVQTQLGGWIGANPQLGYTPARLILNEVTGTGRSALQGTIEVAGRTADVVISNPNGLLCDGCGFINTTRATLTTGTPVFNAQGNLQGFSVTQGQLDIGAGGLNASNIEQLDLIARGLAVNGEVWAQNLDVLAGSNQVLYASTGASPTATAQPGAGATPQFAVSLSSLGSLYGNRIYLLATEAGLGVNSTGRIATLQGNLVLSANGDLTLQDTYATKSMSLSTTGAMTLVGQTQTAAAADGGAPGGIALAAGGALAQQGTLDSAGNLAIAAGSLNQSGTTIQRGSASPMTVDVAGNATNTGTLYSGNDLHVTAATFSDSHGQLQANGALDISASSLAFDGSQIATAGDVRLHATAGTFTATQSGISAGGNLTTSAAATLSNLQGTWQAQGNATLQAAAIVNHDGSVLATGALTASTPGLLDNAGGQLLGSTAVAVTAGRFVNTPSLTHQALVASDQATSVSAQGIDNTGGVISGKTGLAIDTLGAALNNTSGVLVSNSALAITAGAIDTTGGQIISGGQNGSALTIRATNLTNGGGVISAGGASSIAASGALANTQGGTIQSGTDAATADGRLSLSSASLTNTSGSIVSRDTLSITTGTLANDGGTLASTTADLQLLGGSTSNKAGFISGANGTTLTTQAFDNTGGVVQGAASLSLDTQGHALANDGGQVAANGAVDMRIGALSNAHGIVASISDQLRVAAGSVDNTTGTLSAATTLDLLATNTVTNAQGTIVGNGLVTVSGVNGAIDNSSGRIVSNSGATNVTGQTVTNDRGTMSATTTAVVTSTNAMSNRAGQVLAGQTVSLSAAALDNTAGTLNAPHLSLQLGVGTLTNDGGSVTAGAADAGSLRLQAGRIDNRGGAIVTGAALAVDTQGQDIDNTGGTLQAGGALTVSAARLINVQGHVTSLSSTNVATTGMLTNDGGEISAASDGTTAHPGDVTVHAGGTLSNVAGRVVAEGGLHLTAGAVNNARGTIAATTDAALAVASLDNTAGTVQAGNDLALQASGAVANGGSLTAGRDATIAASTVTSSGTVQAPAAVSAGRDLTLAASAIANEQSLIQSGRSLVVQADTLSNKSGGQLLAGGALTVEGLSASTAAIDNTHGLVSAQGPVTITAGQLTNDAGRIDSGGSTNIAAAATSNRAGVITSTTGTTVSAQTLDNTAGEVSSASTLGVDTHGQSLVNEGGRLLATADLTLRAGSIDNAVAGTIASTAGSINLAAVSLANDTGTLSARNAVAANVTGGVSNRAGTIVAGQTIGFSAASVDNTDGNFSGTTLQLAATGGITNAGGVLSAAQDATITAQSLANDASPTQVINGTRVAGEIAAGRDLTLATSNSLTNAALIQGGRATTVTAGALANDGGVIDSLGTLAATIAGNASNRGGVITSTAGTMLTSQAFDNTGGEVSSSDRLSIDTNGRSLANAGGQLIATNDVTVAAGAIGNTALASGTGTTAGIISSSAGNVQLQVASLDNDGGAISAQRSITAQLAGAATNRGGAIIAGQSTTLTADSLDNTQGQVVANQGAASIGTNQIVNAHGLLSGAQALSLTSATHSLVNDGGQIATNGSLSLTAAGLSNVGGTVSGTDTTVALGANALDNTAGQIVGSHGLALTQATLVNANGRIETNGDLALDTHGNAFDNTAGQVVAGGALAVHSTTLANAQGQLVANGALSVNATALSNRAGTLGSTTTATLDVASLDNTDGTVSANILQVTSASAVTNAGGLIAATQDATIDALSLANGASPTRTSGGAPVSGQVIAGRDLAVTTVAGLVNHAALLQSGRDMALNAATLNNDGGLIDSHGALGVTASGAVTNRAGAMDTASGGSSAPGALTLAAASLDNTGGSVDSAAALTVTLPGALVNANGGLLQASAGALQLHAGQTDNTAGAIVGATDAHLTTGALNNTGGIVSTGTDLTLDTQGGALTNAADGVHNASIVAGGTATIGVGTLSNMNLGGTQASIAAQSLAVNASSARNSGVMAATGRGSADGTLAVTTTGALVNDSGTLQSQGGIALQAQSLTDAGGRIVSASASGATTPAISIATTGSLSNANAGLIAAFDGSVTIATQGAAFANAQGGTVYARRDLNLATGSVDNSAGGSLLASGSLTALTLALNNDAGLIQGAALSVDTQGHTLTNTRSAAYAASSGSTAAGGLVSTGNATLATGALVNAGGSIATAGQLAVAAAGAVDNTSGQMFGALGVALSAPTWSVANTGGTIASVQGDVRLTADTIANDGGTIFAAGNATLQATTAISNRVAPVSGTSTQARIAGYDVALATASLDNTGGSIQANHDATITTTRTDNTGGTISALHDVLLVAPTLVNAAGQVLANNAVSVNTASGSFGGTISGSDITLNLPGDYTNTGTLASAHGLTINAANVTNSGTISANDTLSVNAHGNLTNAATGELDGASVLLSATGTLNNQGLVNSTAGGGIASLQAQSIVNGGRIYGDGVALQGNQIANSGTGAVAARQVLAIAGQTISNTGANALMLSLGDMNIGGSFDPTTGLVTGLAGSFTNTAGRVEAADVLNLSATTIVNANGGLQTTTATLPGSSDSVTYVIPSSSTTQFPLSQCVGINGSQDSNYCILHPDVYGKRQDLADAWDVTTLTGGDNDGTQTVTTPHYAWNDPVFAKFGIAAPSGPEPSEPGGSGACTTQTNNDAQTPIPVDSPSCNNWRAADSAWISADTQALNSLQTAITGYNASVDADNATINFEDYTLIKASGTTQQTQVTASTPGQILSGGGMTLTGTSITNTDSRIVAGGLLYVNGQAATSGANPVAAGIQNIATQGVQTTSYTGTSQFTHVEHCGSSLGDKHCRDWDATQPYDPAPVTTHFDLPTVVYQQNASLLQGGVASASAVTTSGNAASGTGSVSGTSVSGAAAPTASSASTAGATAASAASSQQSTVGGVSAGSVTGASAATASGASAGATTVSAASTAAAGTTSTAPSTATTAPSLVAFAGTSATIAATGIVGPARTATAVPTVQRFSVMSADQKARNVILTALPSLSLPTNQLFRIDTAPGAKYLVETDPAFTNYKTFLSSDYFEQQLGMDPSKSLKRYGDGFEEQQLVADQVLALTGRRYLDGYANTQDEYEGLMGAGVAFAKAYQLTPGVALTAAQMALLTTDIVWLTPETVTLPDGTTTQVLVPVVYLRQAQAGDLAPSGALMAGGSLLIQTPGQLVNSASLGGDAIQASAADITNTGTIAANSGLLLAASNDLTNTSGTLIASAGTIALQAGRDIVLQTQTLSSTASVTTADGTSLSSRTSTDRIATIQAGADLLVNAGRDLTIAGASLNASGDIQATAGRDLTVTAVQGSYQIATRATTGATTQGRTSGITQSATTQQASDLAAGGNVTLVAGTVTALNPDATHGNLALVGANVTAGQTVALQGNSVTIAAAKTSEASDIQAVTKNAFTRATQSDEALAGGSISAGDRLTVLANGDATKGQGNITVTGATLTASTAAPAGSLAPTGPDGSAATSPVALAMQATGNLTVQAASTQHDETHEAYSKSNGVLATKTSTSSSSSQFTQLEGSTLSGNTISLRAGDPSTTTGDLTIQASTLNSVGQATLIAGRDLNIIAGNETGATSSASQTSRSASGLANVVGTALNVSSMATIGLPSPVGATLQTHKAGDNSATHTESDAVGSTISVGSLAASAGRDANVQGSTIVADTDISIAAGRNLNIVSAQSTTADTSAASSKTVGNVGTLWQPAVGKAQDSQSSTGASTTQVGSQVASLGGNLTLSAGQTFSQTASSVIAQGDISVSAQKVDIGVAVDTQTGSDKSSFSKTAIGGSVSAPLLSAAQSVASLGDNASKVGDTRLQALAALGAGLQVAGAAQTAMSGDMGGIKVSISLGHDESSSASTQASSTAVGSQLKAGGNLTIAATGAGQDSSLTATGSDLTAVGKTTLKADGAVTLQASQSVVTQHTTNSSSSESLGVGYAMGGAQEGFTIDASAGMAKGHGDGTAVSNTNTHVGGASVDIVSGGDTTLKGAVVTGNLVTATIGGNLNVQSVQDTTTYNAKQQSAGASISLCIPPICYGASTGSASFSDAKISGNFASVTEQSGIKAGDGGFQVAVNGNTTLTGAVISSSQAAIDAGKNSLSTAAIKTTDLHNGDNYSANGVSLSGSVSGSLGDQSSPAAQQKMTDADKHAATGASTGLSTSPGIASQSGSQGSTTTSGVSAGALAITSDAAQQALTGQDAATAASALNRGVTTDQDTTHALTQAWNGQQLMTQTQAALQITSTAMPVVANAIGTAMDKKAADLQAQASAATDPDQQQALLAEAAKYGEGGIYRDAAHMALGGLGGGITGALSAGAAAAAAPTLNQLQDALQTQLLGAGMGDNSSKTVAQLLTGGVVAAVGAATGGTVGAVTALNEDANNRQLHPQERDWLAKNARRVAADAKAADPVAFAGMTDDQIVTLVSQFAAAGVDANATQSLVAQYGSAAGPALAVVLNTLAKDANGAVFVDSAGNAVQMFTNNTVGRGGVVSNLSFYQDSAMYQQYLPTDAQGIAQFARTYGYAPPLSAAQFANLDPAARAALGTAVSTQGQRETGGVAASILNVAQAVGQTGAAAISGAGTTQSAVKPNGGPVGAVFDTTVPIDTQAVLAQQIADLRAALPGSAKTGGNVGIAQIDIPDVPGIPSTMAASSRIQNPTASQQALGFVGQVPETFPSTVVPLPDGTPLLRSVDSEATILNNIAAKLGDNTSATGTIDLLTERSPCDSCSNTIRLFKAKYPNIVVNVMDNGGVIRPTKRP